LKRGDIFSHYCFSAFSLGDQTSPDFDYVTSSRGEDPMGPVKLPIAIDDFLLLRGNSSHFCRYVPQLLMTRSLCQACSLFTLYPILMLSSAAYYTGDYCDGSQANGAWREREKVLYFAIAMALVSVALVVLGYFGGKD
jgi:hypothetical protein